MRDILHWCHLALHGYLTPLAGDSYAHLFITNSNFQACLSQTWLVDFCPANPGLQQHSSPDHIHFCIRGSFAVNGL